MHPNLSVWRTKNDCFLGRCPAPPPHPTPLDAIGASPPSHWNPKHANDWARDIGTDNGTLLKHSSSLVQNWYIWVLWLIWADNYLRLGLASVRASRSERLSLSRPALATPLTRLAQLLIWLTEKWEGDNFRIFTRQVPPQKCVRQLSYIHQRETLNISATVARVSYWIALCYLAL